MINFCIFDNDNLALEKGLYAKYMRILHIAHLLKKKTMMFYSNSCGAHSYLSVVRESISICSEAHYYFQPDKRGVGQLIY